MSAEEICTDVLTDRKLGKSLAVNIDNIHIPVVKVWSALNHKNNTFLSF